MYVLSGTHFGTMSNCNTKGLSRLLCDAGVHARHTFPKAEKQLP